MKLILDDVLCADCPLRDFYKTAEQRTILDEMIALAVQQLELELMLASLHGGTPPIDPSMTEVIVEVWVTEMVISSMDDENDIPNIEGMDDMDLTGPFIILQREMPTVA